MAKSRTRTGRKVRLGAAAALAVTPLSGEVGVDGVGNFAGDIYAENNTKLLYTEAYGTPGSRSWGEWEKLLRTNPFVAMGMDFIGGHIRDARVGVKASEKVADGQRHADFVQWAVTEVMEPGVSEVNQQMVGGLTPGFSLHELVWGNVSHETLPGGTGYAITRMAERLPLTMANNAWHVANNELHHVRQQGPDETGMWRIAEIPAEKLALLSWNRKGNNFAGYSVWRPVWYLAKIQEQLLKLAAIAMVREGAGIPTAVSSTDKAQKLTDGQRKKLQRLLENLVFHENAAVVMPFGWSIEWVYSPGANKGHVLDAWQQLGHTILTMVQAQQLVLGVNGTGSRSVGQTHAAEAMGFIQGIVVSLEAVWNGVGRRPYTGLVKKLVDANFGPQVEYPKLTLTLKKPQLAPKDRLESLKLAVEAGAFTVTADDENVVREELGFGPIDDEERDEERAEAQAAKAAAAPKFLPGQPNPDPGDPGEAKEPIEPGEDDAPPKKFGAAVPFVPRRELRPAEKRIDLGAVVNFLNAAPLDFETRARPVVVEMLAAVVPALNSAMKDGKVTPAEVAALPLDTSRLGSVVSEYLASVRMAGNKSAAKELHTGGADALAKKRAAGKPGVQMAAGGEDEAATAVADADEVTDAQGAALVRRMGNRLRGELERESIDVIRTGGTSGEIIARTVVRQLDTGAFKSDAGSVTAKVFNVGRDEAARIMGGVATVERSAILDNNSCDTCEGKDGDTADFGSPEHDALVPPDRDCEGGDRCRCLLLFIPADRPNADEGADE